jgi:hypothetical protein
MVLIAQINYLSRGRLERLQVDFFRLRSRTESHQATRLDSTQVNFMKSTWGIGVVSRGNIRGHSVSADNPQEFLEE